MTNLPTGLLTVDSSYCFSLSFSFSLSRSIKYVSLTLNYSEFKKKKKKKLLIIRKQLLQLIKILHYPKPKNILF